MPYRRPEYQRPPQCYRKRISLADDAALMQCIAEAVGAALGVTVAQMQAKSKRPLICEARQIAITLIRRRRPHIGYQRIAQFFNQRHTSALNAIRQVETLLDVKDAQLTEKFNKALKALQDANIY